MQSITAERDATAAPAPAAAVRPANVRQALQGLSMLDKVDASALRQVHSEQDLQAAFARREAAVSALKQEMSKDWSPEYAPASIVPPTFKQGDVLHKTARISPAMILQDVPLCRKTKIVCTLGPSCWSEEGLGALLGAGCNVARFNFSHGDHAGHAQVLDRLRKVAADKGAVIGYALDTKGPEIRTAMLKGGEDLLLQEGEEVTVVALGAGYTSWEGGRDPATGAATIGLSYEHLCRDVKPGGRILLSDGTISIEVLEVVDQTHVRGRVLNSHKLGQRKNCNLPGVVVDLPVLGEKDVDDVKNFAAKHDMDYIFASFVQTAADVRHIRQVLEEAGAPHIQIISKIESHSGLVHFDEILAETDGIMVARGDLAMEIPPEKVALAQKMMINKCLVAGKLIICATQMLESMIDNPYPARAEMTDVANAVLDGTGAVMLSGETANGKHPALVLSTMAAIVANTELAVDFSAQYSDIRFNNAGAAPVSPREALLASVSKQAIGFCDDRDGNGVIELKEGCLVVVLTETGEAARLVSKYRPPCPVVVVSNNSRALRQISGMWALYPCQVPKMDDASAAVSAGIECALSRGLAVEGIKVLVVKGVDGRGVGADQHPALTVEHLGLGGMSFIQRRTRSHTDLIMRSPFEAGASPVANSVHIEPAKLVVPAPAHRRRGKIVASLGPATWRPAAMAALHTAGVDVVRLNVKHQSQEENQQLLDMWRGVAAAANQAALANLAAAGVKEVVAAAPVAIMVSIKGHEVRTSRLDPGYDPLPVSAGDTLTLVGVGDAYYSWKGGKAPPGGTTTWQLGLSLEQPGVLLQLGDVLQLDDGGLKVEVTAVEGPGQVVGKALNAHQLPPLSLVCVPQRAVEEGGGGALSGRDLADLQFAGRNQVDYVSVPFVESAAHVRQVRGVLDEAGGALVQIIAQIDNRRALAAFDEILAAADGIMVSRGNLGMSVPPEKVALAQKWMLQRARLAGKPGLVAGQVMEGMADSPRPSRPEITDVVNAVYDGADGIVLMQETSCGEFADLCVTTCGAILHEAEEALECAANFNNLHNWTPKPMTTLESCCSSAVKSVLDMGAALLLILTNSTHAVRLAAKYQAGVPLLVLTQRPAVAAHAALINGAVAFVLPPPAAPTGDQEVSGPPLSELVDLGVQLARALGINSFAAGDASGDQLVLLAGPHVNPFLEPDTFSSAQTTAVVVGDEAAALVAPTGYRGEDTIAYRSTKVSLELITSRVKTPRKTKIVCTLGPSCWSEEGLGTLLGAGCNVARFNFSHGDHAGHAQVLDRLRGVAAAAGVVVATMLDTKGPEIRTAMLKGGEPLQLNAGEEATVVAVGAGYTSWEGGRDPSTGAATIGLSYEHLCRDVKPGGRILLADGSCCVQVLRILNERELVGKVLNSKLLGERKNCNLPGVMVDLPVLGDKDVDDVKNFAAKHDMDFISASFVQSADDVRFIRKVLQEAGAPHIKIISKIESWHGVINYDEILRESDGIMVARGDLAMEVPSEKVALAQKQMITKANIVGKFVITATQMLESMTSAPLPTRAEMTDVANAVWDGTDAVMLSGETAGGKFPTLAVQTMAAIVANAEVGTNSSQAWDFIRDFTDKPMSTWEALLGNLAKAVLDVNAGLVVLLSRNPAAAALAAKYRPRAPVVVVTDDPIHARACAPWFALRPHLVESFPSEELQLEVLLEEVVIHAMETGLCPPGLQVVVARDASLQPAASGPSGGAPALPLVFTKVAPGRAACYSSPATSSNPAYYSSTLSLRTTAISLHDILDQNPADLPPRKTKIVCTLGPSCWSEEGLGALLGAGCNVARFNFSHGDHAGHAQVLDRLRGVAAAAGVVVATMLDTKGPEIRTAMLKGGQDVSIAAGEEVELVAVGPAYQTWEGGRNEATGRVSIGISYAKLCQSVGRGSTVKVADGALALEVLEVTSPTTLRARALNPKVLGQNKNVNLPGVHVAMPVLTDKDVQDLVNWGCRYKVDFVAASFVQTGDDIKFIRRVLDQSGGSHIQIIAKIENEAGLANFNDILALADGIMVARGDLAMEVPSEKVALAQKQMITKANIAGKFVITATQMLESMTSAPLPTRAEMTDVANAVWDGTDAVMLSGETAGGKFPTLAVQTMAAIVANAEVANSYYSTANFLIDHTIKPFTRLEAMAAAAAGMVTDTNASLIVICSATGSAANAVSKYKAAVPQVVVTDDSTVCSQTNMRFGQFGMFVCTMSTQAAPQLLQAATEWAHAKGIWAGRGLVLFMCGTFEANADLQPQLLSWVGDEELEEASTMRQLSRKLSMIA